MTIDQVTEDQELDTGTAQDPPDDPESDQAEEGLLAGPKKPRLFHPVVLSVIALVVAAAGAAGTVFTLMAQQNLAANTECSPPKDPALTGQAPSPAEELRIWLEPILIFGDVDAPWAYHKITCRLEATDEATLSLCTQNLAVCRGMIYEALLSHPDRMNAALRAVGTDLESRLGLPGQVRIEIVETRTV